MLAGAGPMKTSPASAQANQLVGCWQAERVTQFLADGAHFEAPASAVEQPPHQRHQRVDEIQHPRLIEQSRAEQGNA